MKILGVIPARFASSRFPGKPLVNILGKTMIQRVYEQALKASLLDEVVVATDDKFILEHVKSFGGNAVLTSVDHQSGTDRCYEAALKTNKKWDVIINIQGDEPFLEPEKIDLLAQSFQNKNIQICTLICPLNNEEKVMDSNIVKVVIDKNSNALYFSRFPIPYLRNQQMKDWMQDNSYYQHIGIYAFRTQVLHDLVQLCPSRLEKAESLEQLRWLEASYSIKALITSESLPGIDTPDDLNKAEEYLKAKINDRD